MSYWIFKANPENYRIDERLLDPNPNIIWAVTRYFERIKKDDIVFIWRGGTQRGICAVMEIDDCPVEPDINEINDGFEVPPGSVTLGEKHWAKGHFTKRFPVIEVNVIKKIEGLELFSFFSAFQQAINFSITRPEGSILLEFIEKYEKDIAENKIEIPVKQPVRVKKLELAKIPKERTVSKPVGSSRMSSDITLLKCDLCGRYVVSTDKDRHNRENHPGELVDWKKVN